MKTTKISLEGANLTSLQDVVPKKYHLLYAGIYNHLSADQSVIEFLSQFSDLEMVDLSSNQLKNLHFPYENYSMPSIVSMNLSDNPFDDVQEVIQIA